MGNPTTTLVVNPLPGTTVNWYDNNLTPLGGAPSISTALPAQFTYYASQTNTYGCESPRSKILAIVHPTPKIVGSRLYQSDDLRHSIWIDLVAAARSER